MSLRTAAEFREALQAEGLETSIHKGWSTTDRPGGWNPRGVMCHHTGPFTDVPSMVRMLQDGRPDLPGPLCHVGLAPDGTAHLVGWNDTNHAGIGSARVLTAVSNEEPPPHPGEDAVDGNVFFYGIEAIHPGSGLWPPAQVEAMVRIAAAACRLHGWSANSVIGHKEWTRRKWDPGGLDMGDIRDRVAARLKTGLKPTSGTVTKQSEETVGTAVEIAKAVWAHRLTLFADKSEHSAADWLTYANHKADLARDEVETLREELKAKGVL